MRPATPLDQLTSLRFFAAMAVLFSHLTFLAAYPAAPVRAVYERLFHQGACGVAFFFLLSGFIISHAYRDRLRGGDISAGRYLYLRATRIFPLHWLTAIAFMAYLVAIKGQPPQPIAALFNLLLLHSWIPEQTIHYSLNGPSWSISDELFFYCAFIPLVMLRIRTLITVFLGAFLIVTGVAVNTIFTQSAYSPLSEWFFYVLPFTRLLEFVGGMLVYEAWRRGLMRRWSGTATEIVVALAIPAAMVGYSLIELPMPLRWQLAWLPIMAVAVLVFAHGRGALSRWLRAPLPVLLGQASFALYLTHRPIVTAAHDFAPGIDGILLSVGLALICPLIAVAVYQWVEMPVQRFLRGLSWARRPEPLTMRSRPPFPFLRK